MFQLGSIRNRIAMFVSVCFFFLIICIATIFTLSLRDESRNRAFSELSNQAEKEAARVQQTINKAFNTARTIAQQLSAIPSESDTLSLSREEVLIMLRKILEMESS